MINYNPKDWFGLIFRFHKSDTFSKLIWVMLCLAVYSAVLVYLEIEVFNFRKFATPIMHSILGFVISLLLVFRTNTAYDRWWEGRKQWGALVNVSRNLALKLHAFLPRQRQAKRERMREMLGAYAGLLRHHLRNQPYDVLHKALPATVKLQEGEHAPNALANAMQAEILELYQKEELSEAAYLALLNDLNAFTNICGACERIKKTPIPYTYNIFIKKFIFIYIITMPLGFVGELYYYTIGVTVFVFYVLASLELIAEEIEDPFGEDSNDLPTDTLSATIEQNVNEIMQRAAAE